MTGTTIKIDVGDKPVLQAFNALIAELENPAPALKSVGEYLLTSIEVFPARADEPSTSTGARVRRCW
jgi:hypothetical protein